MGSTNMAIAGWILFPSLKGFDFGLDIIPFKEWELENQVSIPQRVRLRPGYQPLADATDGRLKFPSLKGFDFGLDADRWVTSLLGV